jgi:hypothetical protein
MFFFWMLLICPHICNLIVIFHVQLVIQTYFCIRVECLESISSQSSGSQEYLPDGNRPISELQSSNISRGQLFAMTFAFTLKHCVTPAAISDLMALFNVVLPGCLPPNLYYFNKITDVIVTSCKHMFTAITVRRCLVNMIIL